MSGCFPGCFYYTDSCFRKDCTMNHSTPAHKQTDPAKLPGQIVNPINTDLMDDMGKYATPHVQYKPCLAATALTRRGNPVMGSNGTSATDLAKRVTWTTDPPLPEKFTPPFFLPKR